MGSSPQEEAEKSTLPTPTESVGPSETAAGRGGLKGTWKKGKRRERGGERGKERRQNNLFHYNKNVLSFFVCFLTMRVKHDDCQCYIVGLSMFYFVLVLQKKLFTTLPPPLLISQ